MRLLFPSLLSCLLLATAAGQEGSSGWKRPEIKGRPLEGLRVALDIGHYRLKPGATSARGKTELSFNQATTRTIAKVLEGAGAKVIVVNAEATVSALADRPAIAAKAGADCFVSIHHDSVNDKYLRKWTHEGVLRDYADNFRGYSVFASSKNPEAERSRQLALRLGAALHATGLRPTLHHAEPIQGENRPLLDKQTGVYEFTDLVVLKSATMPAILLECGVIVHREEELLVQDPAYQELLGLALVQALAEVFPAKAVEKPGLKGLFKGGKGKG
jgi:N-acetylmuramoyl-L-alanine amidase